MRISEKVLEIVNFICAKRLPVLTIGIAKTVLPDLIFAIKHQRRVPVIRSYAKVFSGH